jgi:hypothetical protein
MAKPGDTIPIQDFNQGGLSKSRWSGIKNTLYKMIGFDPHSTPGILDVAQKLTKISSTTVTSFCKVSLNSSNGCQYFFSSTNGNIWEQPVSGALRLVHDLTPSAGTSAILGACEHEGYIYISTSHKLHRISVENADNNNWAVDCEEDWATFTNGDPDFKPMLSHTPTLVLYIGDGNLLAQVDAGVFTADALDIRDPLRIKSLGSFSTDVLIGTYVSDNFTSTEIIRWNTWDESFVSSDPIPEVGINAFLQADNMTLVQCGKKGNIYYYDGTNLELYSNIPGDYSATAYAEVYPYSVANIEGQILLGLSNGSGNPADCLVYRIARHDRDFPYIMDAPYPISERNDGEFVLSNIEIGGICVSGAYIFVCWKNGSTYGVDRLDATAKLSGAYFETMIMIVDRDELANFSEAQIALAKRSLGGEILPTNTDITMYLSKNYGLYTEAITKQVDTDRNMVTSKDEATEFTTLQLKVKVTTSGNSAPLIESCGVKIQ